MPFFLGLLWCRFFWITSYIWLEFEITTTHWETYLTTIQPQPLFTQIFVCTKWCEIIDTICTTVWRSIFQVPLNPAETSSNHKIICITKTNEMCNHYTPVASEKVIYTNEQTYCDNTQNVMRRGYVLFYVSWTYLELVQSWPRLNTQCKIIHLHIYIRFVKFVIYLNLITGLLGEDK